MGRFHGFCARNRSGGIGAAVGNGNGSVADDTRDESAATGAAESRADRSGRAKRRRGLMVFMTKSSPCRRRRPALMTASLIQAFSIFMEFSSLPRIMCSEAFEVLKSRESVS
jgi:hypothetical protein